MRQPIIIGDKEFKYKKDALLHFKGILNTYNFGETLNPQDFIDVFNLLKLHENSKNKIGVGVDKIKVDEIRYKTKCFHLIRTDSTTDIFSYTKCLNGSYTPLTKFSRTCREIIYEDLRNVKLSYFKANSVKGEVKCQETGDLCTWEELNVDHRQPNTFSVILDRFIEVNDLDINAIEYDEIIDAVYTFKNKQLVDDFKIYHKNKANLRLVKKDKNLGRSYQARIGRQKKDLTIK